MARAFAGAVATDWSSRILASQPYLPRDLKTYTASLLHHLHPSPSAALPPMASPYIAILTRSPAPTAQTLPHISVLLAESVTLETWRLRQRMYHVFGHLNSPHTAPALLTSLDTFLADRLLTCAPLTVAKDISAIKWLCSRHLLPTTLTPLLEDIHKALYKRPHLVERALPLDVTSLREIIQRAQFLGLHREAAAILLAWSTASRIGDLAPLLGRDLSVNAGQLLVCFTTTKAKPTPSTQRADHYASVPLLPAFRPLLNNPPLLPLFTCLNSAQALITTHRPSPSTVALWRARDPRGSTKDHYTLHSIKRGAAWVLWRQASVGKLSLDQLVHMLKHRDVQSSLAYCPEPALIPAAFRALVPALSLADAATHHEHDPD